MGLLPIFEDEILDFIGHPVLALETGCSFLWDDQYLEHISTLNIAKAFITTKDDYLTSIDHNKERVESCLNNMYSMGQRVSNMYMLCNESVKLLKTYEPESFNFFWLDSEEDAEHGLQEYREAIRISKRPFVICIDDYSGENSVKWRLSSEELKKDADFYKTYDTPTGLIVGFFKERG